MKKILSTLIIDFGGMSHGSFFISNGQKDMNVTEKYAFWRFLILNQIRKLKNKFKSDEIIIACDKYTWRKQYFVFYKAARKINRQKSNVDWEMFYKNVDDFLNEIKKYFLAYKIIEINNCEADDIIAVIVNGLRSIRKEIIMVSRDHDFKQLIGNNVRQYDPVTEKFIVCDDPKAYLLMHTLRGDSGDGIPSILNPDDAFIREEYVYTADFKKWFIKNYKDE